MILKITVRGANSIVKDVNEIIPDISAQAESALRIVGREMRESLSSEIIPREVYEKYQPVEYIRRSEDPSLGTPLNAVTSPPFGYLVERDGREMNLKFFYLPDGRHKVQEWHSRDEDTLIKWLQEGVPEKGIPPRPFWEIFLEEQSTDALHTFAENMKPFDVSLENGEKIDFSEFTFK